MAITCPFLGDGSGAQKNMSSNNSISGDKDIDINNNTCPLKDIYTKYSYISVVMYILLLRYVQYIKISKKCKNIITTYINRKLF